MSPNDKMYYYTENIRATSAGQVKVAKILGQLSRQGGEGRVRWGTSPGTGELHLGLRLTDKSGCVQVGSAVTRYLRDSLRSGAQFSPSLEGRKRFALSDLLLRGQRGARWVRWARVTAFLSLPPLPLHCVL